VVQFGAILTEATAPGARASAHAGKERRAELKARVTKREGGVTTVGTPAAHQWAGHKKKTIRNGKSTVCARSQLGHTWWGYSMGTSHLTARVASFLVVVMVASMATAMLVTTLLRVVAAMVVMLEIGVIAEMEVVVAAEEAAVRGIVAPEEVEPVRAMVEVWGLEMVGAMRAMAERAVAEAVAKATVAILVAMLVSVVAGMVVAMVVMLSMLGPTRIQWEALNPLLIGNMPSQAQCKLQLASRKM